jgi:hypothetical protein
MIQYGPNAPCERTRCVEDEPSGDGKTAAHVGGVHLDPHDREHFDGVHIAHVTYKIRDDLNALLVLRKDHPDIAEIIDTAVVSACREIDFLGNQVAHVRVDADRRIREALQQGDSCEFHGRQITELSKQVAALDEAQARTEGARLTLVGLLHELRTFIDGGRARQKLRLPLPDGDTILTALEQAVKKTSAAHDRAWHKPRRAATVSSTADTETETA